MALESGDVVGISNHGRQFIPQRGRGDGESPITVVGC